MSVGAGEFSYAAQLMNKHNFSDQQLQHNIEELIDIFSAGLEPNKPVRLASGHPINNFMAENQELMKLAQNLLGPRENLAETYEKLLQVNIHYTRKESLLFPYFERYGFDKPSTVMWDVHNEIRKSVKMCQYLLNSGNLEELAEIEPKMLEDLQSMVTKEELILFPTALEMLSDDDWIEISAAEGEIGFCLIQIPEQ
ncbi:MAG: DUF438 domain-containing protein [bacterium]|nr:DUF438 domain-containing protein [bacterium]